MKFRLLNNLTQTPAYIIKKCGYLYITDRITGKHSFVRKISSSRYPRFHLYISESPKKIVFDLHLDQSKTHYQGQIAHSADYESKQVKAELTRIYQIVVTFQINKSIINN